MLNRLKKLFHQLNFLSFSGYWIRTNPPSSVKVLNRLRPTSVFKSISFLLSSKRFCVRFYLIVDITLRDVPIFLNVYKYISLSIISYCSIYKFIFNYKK